jgi:four helix bundle protein
VENGKVKMENGRKRLDPAESARITDFTQLDVWRIARKLRIEAYAIAKLFPTEEKYGLALQLRRAAVSITANIAEGYGRYSYQENIQFCRHSRGSAYEVRDHFITALDAGYIPREKYKEARALAISVIRLLNGYIRSTAKLKGRASRE